MEFLSNKIIKIDRELSELDLFTIDFIRILRNHVRYAIVSGYVSILLGRARSSEDIDIIIPKISKIDFIKLFKDINEKFYCLNTGKENDAFEYIETKSAIRFAKIDTVIPNIELKFVKNKIDEETLSNTITVELKDEKLITSNLEMQIAFKEEILKSPKDIEDARHIRNVAAKFLNHKMIERYKMMINELY